MHFASPHYLWLLVLLVPMVGYYVWRTLQGGAAIQISTVRGVAGAPRTVRSVGNAAQEGLCFPCAAIRPSARETRCPPL